MNTSQKTIREELIQTVKKCSIKTGTPRNIIWNELYSEVYYRLKENVKIDAKNRGISTLDYLERENLLLAVYRIALELFS